MCTRSRYNRDAFGERRCTEAAGEAAERSPKLKQWLARVARDGEICACYETSGAVYVHRAIHFNTVPLATFDERDYIITS